MTLAVSRSRRLIQVISAVLFNVTCAGVIFGFAALKPVLVKEGVYFELCSDTDDDNRRYGRPCKQQDLQLNFMFTVSTVVTNLVALPIGAMMDIIGPRTTTLIGTLAFFSGNVIFPLGYQARWIDTYLIGYVLLAIGGPLVFLPSFHLSNAFPLHAGLILSCVTGAFDASAIPYLIYDTIYKRVGGIDLRTFFWSYAVIPVLLAIAQLTLASSKAYQRCDFLECKAHTGNDTEDVDINNGGSQTVVGSSQNSLSDEGLGALKHVDESGDKVVGVMFGKSVKAQILSTWFSAIVFFLCIYMTRINYLIQTVASQLSFYLNDGELARSITTTFTVLLPLGGIVGIPFVGWLLDNRTVLEGSDTILLMGVVFGVLGMAPSVISQIISIAVFVILRPFMYTFVGDYCGKVFGYEHFGTVYGLATSLSGAFGLVLHPIDVFVKVSLGGNYTPANVAGMLVGLLASSLLSVKIRRGTQGIIMN